MSNTQLDTYLQEIGVRVARAGAHLRSTMGTDVSLLWENAKLKAIAADDGVEMRRLLELAVRTIGAEAPRQDDKQQQFATLHMTVVGDMTTLRLDPPPAPVVDVESRELLPSEAPPAEYVEPEPDLDDFAATLQTLLAATPPPKATGDA